MYTQHSHHCISVRCRNKVIASPSVLPLPLLFNAVSPLKGKEINEIKRGVDRDYYDMENGGIVKRSDVEQGLIKHFSVEPGDSRRFSQAVIKNLPTSEQIKLKQMMARNVLLKKAINEALKLGNQEALKQLGLHLRNATMGFVHFFIRNNIPMIQEISTEIGVENTLKMFSGGLGVLNGDKIKEASDRNLPLNFFTVCPEHGYSKQSINLQTNQQDYKPDAWDPMKNPLLFTLNEGDFGGDENGSKPLTISIPMGPGMNRQIKANILVHGVIGERGWINPIFGFTTYHANKSQMKKEVTRELYPDGELKLASQYCLSYIANWLIHKFNMQTALVNLNEGHSAFFPVIRMMEELKAAGVNLSDEGKVDEIVAERKEDIARILSNIRRNTTMVTHTIDRSAFDSYEEPQARNVLPAEILNTIFILVNPEFPESCDFGGWRKIIQFYGISMADIGIFFASMINAVAKIHEQITKTRVFPKDKAKTTNVTNAIHQATWWARGSEILELLKPVAGDMRQSYMNGFSLLALKNSPAFRKMVANHHRAEKRDTIAYLNELIINNYGVEHRIRLHQIDKTMTVVSARRAKGYKQNDVPVIDDVLEYYKQIADGLSEDERIVMVFAGKAHQRDFEGRGMIEHILNKRQQIADITEGKVLILVKENYDMDDGKMFSKFDLLLANPVVGWEASGTSPMKNPLRVIMHTYDGFFAEFDEIARNLFKIESPSFGFGPRKPETDYQRQNLKQEYAKAFGEKFVEVVDTYFRDPNAWCDKQIEQLGIFTMCFQMTRFLDNYLTQWRTHVPQFQDLWKSVVNQDPS